MVQLAGVQLVPAVTHDGLSNELFGTVTGTVPAQAPDVTTKSATNKAIPKLVRIPILRFSSSIYIYARTAPAFGCFCRLAENLIARQVLLVAPVWVLIGEAMLSVSNYTVRLSSIAKEQGGLARCNKHISYIESTG
jgi:hypothetical protein